MFCSDAGVLAMKSHQSGFIWVSHRTGMCLNTLYSAQFSSVLTENEVRDLWVMLVLYNEINLQLLTLFNKTNSRQMIYPLETFICRAESSRIWVKRFSAVNQKVVWIYCYIIASNKHPFSNVNRTLRVQSYLVFNNVLKMLAQKLFMESFSETI